MPSSTPPPWVDAESLMRLLDWTAAVDALEAAALERVGPETGPARTALGLDPGQLLLMPSASPGGVGVKLVTVAPEGGPAPRVKGVYVLFDRDSLAPVLLVDGAALTTLRTSAHSALAVRHLARPDASRVVVFGAGPQAEGHVAAIRSTRPVREVVVVTRDPAHAEDLVRRLDGVEARTGTPGDVADADVVVCATTARSPLFDGRDLDSDVCVVAVGSHQPDARELDDEVFRRASRVVVEERQAALREAGDIIQTMDAGVLAEDDLEELPNALRTQPLHGITVFKSVGLPWQDLAIVEAVRRAAS
jgi:ornithine cyclodeaminase/alanine dehydrogenase-like protein (mu-crystallin family)